MKKKIKSKVSKKKIPLTKSLGELVKDEDGFVSKETILKVGLSTVAVLGAVGTLLEAHTFPGANHFVHTNVVGPERPCASHTNINTHHSY
jgi:hypothetical protein